jgi:hypothetical protein
VPEIALELVGLGRVGGPNPAEQHVLAPLAGVLQEALSQVDVVAADLLDDLPRGNALQEIDSGLGRWDVPGDVGLGQADRGLDSRSGGNLGK